MNDRAITQLNSVIRISDLLTARLTSRRLILRKWDHSTA